MTLKTLITLFISITSFWTWKIRGNIPWNTIIPTEHCYALGDSESIWRSHVAMNRIRGQNRHCKVSHSKCTCLWEHSLSECYVVVLILNDPPIKLSTLVIFTCKIWNKPYFGGPMQKTFSRDPIVISTLTTQNEVLHTALVPYRESLSLSLFLFLLYSLHPSRIGLRRHQEIWAQKHGSCYHATHHLFGKCDMGEVENATPTYDMIRLLVTYYGFDFGKG